MTEVWVMTRAKAKKWNGINGRVYSVYCVYIYSQWTTIPLQALDRHVLTVRAITGPIAILKPFIGTIPAVMNLHDWQRHSRKISQ